MPPRLAIALVGIVFVVTLLVHLPASWVTALLPEGVACTDPSGTLWHGACAQVRAAGVDISDLHWSLHGLSLLTGHPRVDVSSNDPRAQGSASVSIGRNGDADITALDASLPLEAGLLPVPGWNGQLQLEIAHAALASGRLQSIEGTARVLQLQWAQPVTDFGGFEVTFPPTDAGVPIRGALHDLGGPILAQGTLQLNGNAYELDALLSARNGADANMEQLLQMVGPADAQGRHSLSIAGSY